MLDRNALIDQKRRLPSLLRDPSTAWSEYSQDLWFTLAALEHPMRTRDPDAAQLFIVPFLTHFAVEDTVNKQRHKPRFCWDSLCGREVIDHVDRFLRDSPYLERRPARVGDHASRGATRLGGHDPGGTLSRVGIGGEDQIEEDSNQLYARILREEILPLYDFVAVTERMDESLVVLKMLWGLDTGDIIVSAAKAGEWSYNWNPKGTCFKIPRTVKTQGVLDYIQTDFRRANGDFLLHAVANRSLDLTIDALGREEFDREFTKYKQLKTTTTALCQGNATFPCSKTGEWQEGFREDCYEYDVGCGYRCIDNLLDQYERGEFALGM